jgi:hypothetical protein
LNFFCPAELDYGVKEIVDALKAAGMWENTVLVRIYLPSLQANLTFVSFCADVIISKCTRPL